MKKTTAILTAAAAVMLTTPAMAHGYLGLNYGNTNLDAGEGEEADISNWQADGAIGSGHGGWGWQADASAGNLEGEGGEGDASFWTVTGHLYWGGDGWRVGGVAGLTDVEEIDDSEWMIGAEGAIDFTPNAEGFASATWGGLEEVDLWNIDGGVNVFPSPNVRIGGTIGIGHIEGEGGEGEADTFSAGINGEIQPWSAPISIVGGWNLFNIDDADIDSNTFTIGARWNFGGGSVQERHNFTGIDTYTGYLNRFYGIY
ncbi:MAG: hypothetical protein AB7J28_16910 [Hyphomonadaceae bacterium]